MYFPKDGWSFTFDLDGVEINGKILNEIIGAKKPNNNAPKSIKGDYDLSIHGNKIVLVDNIDGTTVEAKCHPDDDFDIGEGMKEAFKKLNEKREENRKQKEEEDKKIKVGDWVEVVNSGRSYSTLGYSFFERNNIMHYAIPYRYGVSPERGTKGKVVFITDANSYVICVDRDKEYGDKEYSDLNCYDTIYIVGQEGLKKVAKPRA